MVDDRSPRVMAEFAPPEATVEAPVDVLRAGPWRRWLARYFDLSWQFLLLRLTTIAVGSIASSEPILQWKAKGDGQIFFAVMLPIALMMDAVSHHLFRNSPGKALFRIAVTTPEGAPLSFGDHVRRNLRVWFFGFGLGIPIVTLITMAWQRGRVKREGFASYDVKPGTRVRASTLSSARVLATIAIFVTLIGVVFAVNFDESAWRKATRSRGNPPSRTWLNPKTGLDATIEGFWTSTVRTEPSGLEITTFAEPLDLVVVMLSSEVLDGVALRDYVAGLRPTMAPRMNFAGEGSYFQHAGRSAWVGHAELVGDARNRIEIMIVQYETTFWRTMTVQMKPETATDAIASRLRTALWNTVR